MHEDRMTKEEFLANRKAAGLAIDVETCDIAEWYARIVDPYGVDPDSDPCVGKTLFVASLLSDGWVYAGDLPEDQRRALHARIDRAARTPTTAEGVRDVLLEEYAHAVAKLDDVIYELVVVVAMAVVFRVFRSILFGVAPASRSRSWASKARRCKSGSSGNCVGLNGMSLIG